MDPSLPPPSAGGSRLPRTRGDGPAKSLARVLSSVASPHTRGWTPLRTSGIMSGSGFPAHAGMDPRADRPAGALHGLPRTRGDGPQIGLFDSRVGMASPHTRGWTRLLRQRGAGTGGFPAHAGMDPRRLYPSTRSPGLPRTRGDGPVILWMTVTPEQASPHTRGWTRLSGEQGAEAGGFPAHAGMDPHRVRYSVAAMRLPRTRGDGPALRRTSADTSTASPHTRGWTRLDPRPHVVENGFPAHAGMDPRPRRRPG